MVRKKMEEIGKFQTVKFEKETAYVENVLDVRSYLNLSMLDV